ncbi:MAG: LON peptidase substrate-binding domain-containing protein [Blastocatellia bacterium]|nr:LON peptidase substrate-binding domain-containing protein [Blastocatellia bacterium]MCS7156944.1 LON peptidase substrate-binding domain-containing protein [Blastocatellia bacterium]MDW8167636.1 LON peptidase substrate-binding domain-containing protein [Acidobacteriota bacterium]MDW8256236.1 LON peptidase substrate-binding domain-containing protein [Acidobacteriota bacterium]
MRKTNDSRRLPIFPLPVVLLPEMRLPLHIFEPRYQLMLRHCLEGDRLFGLSYHSDAEVGRLVVPDLESIGCAAHILHVQPLMDGRANILTIGTDRYRIRRYLSHDPYLLAEVEFFEDVPPEGEERETVTILVAHAAALFSRLLRALRLLQDLPDQPVALPENAERLSFTIAAAVLQQPEELQQVLELVSTRTRLELLLTHLEKLVADYEHRARAHVEAKWNGQRKPPSQVH